MSTLTVGNIQNLTGTASTSSDNVINGSAKAWVNFNGTTSPGTIRSQYNVSSVTKNGTGDYTVNFTNALVDANYSQTMGVSFNVNMANTAQNLVITIRDQAASSCRVYTASCWNTTASNAIAHDTTNICVSIHR